MRTPGSGKTTLSSASIPPAGAGAAPIPKQTLGDSPDHKLKELVVDLPAANVRTFNSMVSGCRVPIGSKGKQRDGTVFPFSGNRFIEATPAVIQTASVRP